MNFIFNFSNIVVHISKKNRFLFEIMIFDKFQFAIFNRSNKTIFHFLTNHVFFVKNNKITFEKFAKQKHRRIKFLTR